MQEWEKKMHFRFYILIIVTSLYDLLKPELGSTEKPEEIFHIIEHFCLGRRRLHLFSNDSAIRPGE